MVRSLWARTAHRTAQQRQYARTQGGPCHERTGGAGSAARACGAGRRAAIGCELAPAGDRLPAAGRARPPLLALTTITVAVGAIHAISLTGLGRDTPRAFAGWSATPTKLTRARAHVDACLSEVARAQGMTERSGATPSGSPRPSHIPAGGWRAVLVDTRGPFTVVLVTAARGRAQMTCFFGRNAGSDSFGGSVAGNAPHR